MGTRNLTLVKNNNGTTKIALYGQWDGYPEYSGLEALRFLRDKYNQNLLNVKLDIVQFVSEEESDATWESFEHDDNDPSKADAAMPGLTRNTGISILQAVANSTGTSPIKMIDNSDFANDELFCEGIYEVDFSTNKFISTYHGHRVEYDLDTLPDDGDYLIAMSVPADTITA
jgi:hypothetical protein